MRCTVPGGSLTLDTSVLDAPVERIDQQVTEYCRGERQQFDIPVRYPDDFTGRVMRAIHAIPYGETRTYGELADTIDSSPVAVGGACGRNPVPLIVPCHRVVGATSLGGFSAEGGVELKQALLAHESTGTQQQPLTEYE